MWARASPTAAAQTNDDNEKADDQHQDADRATDDRTGPRRGNASNEQRRRTASDQQHWD